MKYNKFTKFFFAGLLAVLFGGISWAAVSAISQTNEENVVFSDSFADLTDAGNGGSTVFSGQVAASKLTEREGWQTLTNVFQGQECVKLGTSSKDGVLTSNAITLTGNATLTFQAAGWGSGNNTLAVTATGALVDDNANLALSNGSYTDYTVELTGASGEVTITFTGKRFFLKNVKLVATGGVADNRAETMVELGEHQTTGVVNESMNLPTATVHEVTGAPIDNAEIEWTSSNPEVAAIANGSINFLSVGTTDIKASYAGDNSYKPSSASFTLSVTAAPYTSFQALQADATSAKVPVTVVFDGQQVVFVNGSNVFMADEDGFGLLIYTSNHGLEVGDKLYGTVNCTLTLYQGNTEITGFSKEGLQIENAEVVPVVKTVGEVNANSQSTLVTLKNVTYSVGESDKLFSDETSSIVFYDKFKTKVELTEGQAYDVTGVVVLFNDKLEICPRTADDIVEASNIEPEPWVWRNITLDLTDGNLLNADELVQWQQLPEIGIVVAEDGTVRRVAADASNAAAVLTGKWHSNEHGWANFKAVVPVEGPVTITLGTCAWGGEVKVTNSAGEVVGTFNTNNGACFHNNKDANVVSYNYVGEATTLTIEGGNYVPFFEVKTYVEPAPFQEFAVIVNNQEGTLLTTDEQVQGTDINFGVAVVDGQTVRVAVDDASSIATVSGKYHGEHGCTNLKVVVPVPGSVKILVGQCTYSGKTIYVTNSQGETVASKTPASACWKNDRSNVTEVVYSGPATTLTITGMDYCPFVAVKEYVEPAPYQDFAVIVNNQEGTLLTTEEMATQHTPFTFGVAVVDGQTVRVAADDANSIATVSGKFHGEHGSTNLKVVVPVPGAVKILVGQCTYSSKDIVVTNSDAETVATATPAQVCWKNDRSNVTELTYVGPATTLTITGPDYCPYVALVKIDDPATDVVGTWDYANSEVMAATMAFTGSSESGEVEAIEKNGLMMIVEANGASFRNNGNNIQVRNGAVFKVPVRNAGDIVTVKGYPGYSYYTIGNNPTEITNTQDNPATVYTAKISDAEAGYVAVTSTNDNNYYLMLSVVQKAPKEKITLDNEPATVNFPFDEGSDGQKATFSNDDYFLNSKVTIGANWSIQDKTTYEGTTETRLTPVDQHNDNLTDDDAVSFTFTPKPGFVFTPTKVSFKTNRFGTDNGLIDAYWQNPDGTTVVLETEIKPERNNSGTVTVKNYDITGATPGEGTCGLKLFLYHLQATKSIGLADIVIEGILDGTEKDVPILASFKINGNTYAVEDVFGESYEATLELPKAEQMVSANNPLTDVTASSGDVGEITYEEKNDACTVTIPMTAGDTRMDYVLNVVFKPDFTLTYLGVEGDVLGTQTVEKDAAIGRFAYDIADVPATKDGYKARGWFKQGVLGEKFTTDDIITANTTLYAIQTEIEEPSTHKKYFFDLADKYFYPEDHEAFNPAGEGYYWHDAQHGWAFKDGNTIDLLVGPKATITVTLCQYGYGTGIAVKKGDETLATIEGKSDGDGGTAVYNYEGEPGTLTLEMQATGEMYIHAVKIVNTSEVNFESQGNWYFVKAGDAGSLIDVIDVVNGLNASREALRSYIFLPDGIYDLDATVKTAITGHNISIIGQSMENTIIVTKPDKSIEGLGKADLLDVSGTNLYLQDLTLQNALDYYSAGSAGRAAVLQDAGNRTIGKNVRMLSYQDTYYSSNSSQQAYWEDCDIHGTVDFICGGGDIRFQNTTISLEPRAKDGSGSRTITAPTTNTQFGYVFDGCKVVDLAEGKGSWNFGRTWQNEPISVFLNTTLDDNAKNTLISTRWIERGMNNKDPKLFGEYHTMDADGNDITPASNIINSFGGQFQTILTQEQAEGFAYDKMFTTWDPAAAAKQIDATAANAHYDNGTVSFDLMDNGMQGCAIFKNGVFAGLSFDGIFNIDIDPTVDELTIRAANQMGGFGPVAHVEGTVTTSISDSLTETPADVIYNLQGVRVSQPTRGLYIVNGRKVVVK